jgi:hypothetical protein
VLCEGLRAVWLASPPPKFVDKTDGQKTNDFVILRSRLRVFMIQGLGLSQKRTNFGPYLASLNIWEAALSVLCGGSSYLDTRFSHIALYYKYFEPFRDLEDP